MAARTTIRESGRLPHGVEAVLVASDDVAGGASLRRIEPSAEIEPPRTVTLYELVIRGSTAPVAEIESECNTTATRGKASCETTGGDGASDR